MKENAASITLCRAVVAYCDVTGFMTWVKRATTSHGDVVPFIQKMKEIFRQFHAQTGYYALPIGDGIIALVVINEKKPAGILPFLKATLATQRKMRRLISRTAYPRPAGFRIRVTSGIVFRSDGPPSTCKLTSPHIDCPVMKTTDFIGDCLNLGSRLLEVRRDVSAILHESVLAIMPKRERRRLRLRRIKIDPDERPPRGVDIEDMRSLYEFRA